MQSAPWTAVRLVVALALWLVAITPVMYAQQADGGGLQFVADNVATASAAARLAPLAPQLVGGLDGSESGRTVALPAGFSASQVAVGLQNPRFMAFDDAGNLLVADAKAGKVYRYGAAAGSITASDQPPAALVSGLEAPSNVALHDGYLYIGETRTISRYAYTAGGGVGQREAVVQNLPRGGHSTRTVVFGPDGRMYVSVGSSCNICDETDERRAAILRFAPDGFFLGYERFAYGLRNAVGLTVQPGTGLLWATVNERDNQGNETPPDLVTIVGQGQNFGWPGCQPPDATLELLPMLRMPARHELLPELDVAPPYLRKILLKTYERAPEDFETLLGIEGVGPKTLRALALASELVHGTPASLRDPARFAFAHGGKDGTPFPVDKLTYDKTIEILNQAINRSAIDRSEKVGAFRRLANFDAALSNS